MMQIAVLSQALVPDGFMKNGHQCVFLYAQRHTLPSCPIAGKLFSENIQARKKHLVTPANIRYF
jgi:hypothetical protein